MKWTSANRDHLPFLHTTAKIHKFDIAPYEIIYMMCRYSNQNIERIWVCLGIGPRKIKVFVARTTRARGLLPHFQIHPYQNRVMCQNPHARMVPFVNGYLFRYSPKCNFTINTQLSPFPSAGETVGGRESSRARSPPPRPPPIKMEVFFGMNGKRFRNFTINILSGWWLTHPSEQY